MYALVVDLAQLKKIYHSSKSSLCQIIQSDEYHSVQSSGSWATKLTYTGLTLLLHSNLYMIQVYDVGSCKGDSGAPLIEIINKDGKSKVLIRGVVHGCIGACCSKDYPTVFANLADKKIWNFVMKETSNPKTIYVDKKSDQEWKCEKNKKKFNFKIDKFGNKICLQVSKKQAVIGGVAGAVVVLIIVASLIYCRCVRQKRR